MKHTYTNELVHETSPYLLQHAHNPVDWLPWGDEVLKKAKEEGKLLIISIGYSSCHWCHVMEHESFEDKRVARLMNEQFVSVKVDREERPDVDQVYMNAAYLVTGSGGWPLNVIALPDGRPVYAGTYFPKENWIKLLDHFISLQEEQPALLIEQAEKIEQGLIKMEDFPVIGDPNPFKLTEIISFTQSLINNIDFQKGGTRGAPKFPMPGIFEYLLHYHALRKDDNVLEAINITLKQMAMGGIYDHIGGGFARYSVDDHWFVPHFEKMLYDNAQLISLYARAYQLTREPLYKTIVYESTDFIDRELSSPQGGFYAALDADSEGMEGKFYTWTKKEIDQVLGDDADLFSKYYNITHDGNWENNQNILFVNDPDEAIISFQKIKSLKKAMLEARSKRISPGLDNKVLTSWNALMLNAYIDSYRTFNDQIFLDRALKNAQFLSGFLVQDDYSLMRNYMNDQAGINGFLDDYAFTISAFINLYQATFDESWLQISHQLTEYTLHHFFDPATDSFYYTSDEDSGLITRSRELSDNVIPSSSSEMAKNLYFLGTFFENRDYIVKASRLIGAMKEKMLRHPSFHSNWGRLMLYLSDPPMEIAIMGKETQKKRAEFDQGFLPQALFSGGDEEGTLPILQQRMVNDQTTIYVCRNKTCQLPVKSVKEAMIQIKDYSSTV